MRPPGVANRVCIALALGLTSLSRYKKVVDDIWTGRSKRIAVRRVVLPAVSHDAICSATTFIGPTVKTMSYNSLLSCYELLNNTASRST
jgi:hypothetical protein